MLMICPTKGVIYVRSRRTGLHLWKAEIPERQQAEYIETHPPLSDLETKRSHPVRLHLEAPRGLMALFHRVVMIRILALNREVGGTYLIHVLIS